MRQQTVTKEVLKQFAKENSWAHKMNSSQGLDGRANYMGEDHGDFVVVIGRNRDSNMLDESNFAAALEMLGGESSTVKVERFGHWGCGWFELIMVSPGAPRKLQTAFEIKRALEHYPVLDDADYSERESEQRERDFDNYLSDFKKNYFELTGLTEEDDSEDLDALLHAAHYEDCSYRGVEDAYVSDRMLVRFASTYECRQLSIEGNEYASYLITVCGLEPEQQKAQVLSFPEVSK